MADKFNALDLLKSLGDFDDPTGPACRLQIESLRNELEQIAIENPGATFRVQEDGPEQTIAEILAELDAEEIAISVLKKALKQ